MLRIRDIDWYYINLASRPDRDNHAREQFQRYNIRARRFEGFTPEEWPGDSTKVDRMRKRTPGAVGCYQSQMHIIRLAQGGDRVVAVCEDDVVLCNDLEKRLDYIDSNLVWDWDIFYLGATFHVPGVWCHHKDCATWGSIGVDAEPTTDPRILRTYGIWGTYAYLVNPKNAAKVCTLFDEHIHQSDGIDHLAIRLGSRLNTFCFIPGCAWQYDSESNIGNGITRFSSFKKLGPYAWTDRMEEFNPLGFDWNP